MIKKRVIWGICFAIVVLIIAAFCGTFLIFPKVVEIWPQDKSQNIRVDSEIKIKFSRPINRDTLIPSINPEISGNWQYQDPLFSTPKFLEKFKKYNFLENHFYQTLVFVPDQVLMPETNYQIELKGIKRVLNFGKTQDFSFGFSTQTLPKVSAVSPEAEKKDVPPFSEIKIKLTQPNLELVNFDFILEPAIDIEIKINETKDEYTLVPKNGFEQGIKYNSRVLGTFVVKDKKTGEIIFQDEAKDLYQGSFETAPPPKISSFKPTSDGVLVNQDIKIVFSDSMQRKSVEENFSISPAIEGNFSWSEDNKTLIYKPATQMPYETTFQITVKKGALNEKGAYLPEDVKFSFKTIGRIWASLSPRNGATGVSVKTPVKVYFNQSVDQKSAIEHFQINPETEGSFSFNGNTMIFQPSLPFSPQTTYKVKILPGVKSIYGLDSNQTFETSFTTELQTIKLAVPMDFQDYPLSCEAASLKMALAYKGVYVSENQIMGYLNVDSAPRQDNIWGNPYQGYVGDINGKQNVTGYGVYWGPIAEVAKIWRPNSQSFSGWNLSDLTKEIKNGNTVIVWGVIGNNAYQDSWYTKDGKYIYAWKGEHARVAIGFIGDPNSPSKIILNDPWAGQIYLSTSAFLSNWNTFGRSGVVIK